MIANWSSYQVVQMCVALALGYNQIRQSSAEDEVKGDKLLQDLWDILTQYSKLVLKEVSHLFSKYRKIVWLQYEYYT